MAPIRTRPWAQDPTGLESTLDPAVIPLPSVTQGPSNTGGDGAALQSVPSLGCDGGGEKAGSLRRNSPNLALRRDAQGHHCSRQDLPAPHHRLWGPRGSWRNVVDQGHQEEGRECSGSSPRSSSPSLMCIFMTMFQQIARKHLEKWHLLLFLTKASYDIMVVQTVCQAGKR